MTIMKRIANIILGLITIICALFIFWRPEFGLYMALGIFTLVFLIYSVRMIVYYFTLARHMVGGQIILFLGVFALGVSIYAFSITAAPPHTVSAILVVILLFMGLVDLLRAREAKKGGAGSWKFSMITAVIEVILAALCIIFTVTNPNVTSIVFAIALVYSGVSRIISALRKANWNKIIKNNSELDGRSMNK